MPDFSNFFLVLYWRWLVFETSRSTLGTIVSSSHLTPIKNWSQAREGYQVKETKDHQGPMTRKNLLLSELAICVPRCPAVSLLCSPGTATSQFEESRQVSRSGPELSESRVGFALGPSRGHSVSTSTLRTRANCQYLKVL